MKIVLLGACHWHAPCYHVPAAKLGHEVILIDADAALVRQKAAAGGYAWSADYGDLDRLRPDFAVCLGRHDQMAGLCGLCLERGIPFLAEKPGAPDAATMASLAARADAAGLFHAAPFCQRWDPAARQVQRLLQSGRLGRVARVQATYFSGAASRYVGWRCGWVLEKEHACGGSLYNVGMHLLDLLHFWGFAPSYRAGRSSYSLNRGEVDDVASLLLDCGEAYALVESGYLVQSPCGGIGYSLFCERANIDYAHNTLRLAWADGQVETMINPTPEPRDLMMADLLARLQAGQPAPATLHDMAAALALCDAFRRDHP